MQKIMAIVEMGGRVFVAAIKVIPKIPIIEQIIWKVFLFILMSIFFKLNIRYNYQVDLSKGLHFFFAGGGSAA